MTTFTKDVEMCSALNNFRRNTLRYRFYSLILTNSSFSSVCFPILRFQEWTSKQKDFLVCYGLEIFVLGYATVSVRRTIEYQFAVSCMYFPAATIFSCTCQGFRCTFCTRAPVELEQSQHYYTSTSVELFWLLAGSLVEILA